MWEYIAQNDPVGVKSVRLNYKSRFRVEIYRGKKKVQKKGVFFGVKMGVRSEMGS